jgi:hypothetical protein
MTRLSAARRNSTNFWRSALQLSQQYSALEGLIPPLLHMTPQSLGVACYRVDLSARILQSSRHPPKKMWSQIYDPLGNTFLSTLAAVIPIAVLLGGIGLFRLKAHLAALLGLLSSLVIAVPAFRMPTGMGLRVGRLWRSVWIPAHKLDRAQCHLPLSAHP